uniref:Uncharacterized protein n=1 Tax=Arundo donax TaxID=35708 RepID=A0A0A9B7B7_ARUDO
MLDGWGASRKARRGGAESASGTSSEASEVSYGGAAVVLAAPATGGPPPFEYERKPAVAPQQTQLSAIESWLFDDDSNFHHVQSGSLLDVVALDYPF